MGTSVLAGLGVSYVAISRLVMARTTEGQARVEGHYHQVFSHVSDTVSNISVLQSYGRIARETDALRRYMRERGRNGIEPLAKKELGYSGPQLEQAIRIVFQRFDRNGDGFLTASEVQPMNAGETVQASFLRLRR